jgi:hypothetical protein
VRRAGHRVEQADWRDGESGLGSGRHGRLGAGVVCGEVGGGGNRGKHRLEGSLFLVSGCCAGFVLLGRFTRNRSERERKR